MIMHCRKLIHNPGLLKIASIVLGILLLILPIGCVGEAPSPVPPENVTYPVETPPNKIKVNQPTDPMKIAFGVIADTHMDSSSEVNIGTIKGLNDLGKSYNILGVVHLGDFIHQPTDNFLDRGRLYYEDDYPYPNENGIQFPVFLGMGNHDSPPHPGWGNGYWLGAQNYIGERILGAPDIIYYQSNDELCQDKSTYAWHWGNYFFVQLGLWAGSGTEKSSAFIDYKKLDWLDNLLRTEVGTSGDGVFILQHYGWDWFSIEKQSGSDKKYEWWSDFQRNLELDILCRRYYSSDSNPKPNPNSEGIADPYNVLGIFTGHVHQQHVIPISAGKDKNGDNVTFTSYTLPAAGVEKDNRDTGYAVVTVNGTKMDIMFKFTNRDNLTISNEPNIAPTPTWMK